MSAPSDKRDQQYAPEISARYLPGVSYAPLPEPRPLKDVLGPSVLLLAGAIGSGEFVLWPYISTQTGLVLVWLAVVGILTQYYLNMEITRYTLATGETAVTGFTRLWKHWSWLFILMAVIPWMWPGWATGSATAFTYVFGLSEGTVVPITIGVLVVIGLVLTVSPVVYRTVEKIQFLLVALIVIFMIYILVGLLRGDAWSGLAGGLTTDIPQIPDAIGTVGIAAILGAIAFAGAGGVMNLAQSNWVRDKGLGMGERLPKIVSPITGEEETEAAIGYFFPQDEENLRRWRGWWKVAHREQFTTFFVLGLAAILLFMMLAYTTVGRGTSAEGFEFIRLEGEMLKSEHANWVGNAFWFTGMIVLLSTNLTVLDMVARITADIVKTNWMRASKTWTESRIYVAMVWAMIVFGSSILLAGFDQPLVLIITSAALNGIVMFIYSVLLIRLNRGMLPRAIGLKGFRLGAVSWAVLFYGGFSIFLVWDTILAPLF
ncbi:Nramp family divalent metal transporter [Ornithinimicrobium cavernae]|uniref:Nramp family divalent metal transporter n=1 Tax=Ornithinimicrobium cavernae TaxID=2666047 RepID=UPI000D687B16|nr:Nramp family divalent metal transporter [Ornithinimicrobium cavernae]